MTALDSFLKLFLLSKDKEECSRFFKDICTITELKSIAQRLEVAKLLMEGYTYHQIEEITGASTATISRVKRYLYYGDGGYRIVLERLQKKFERIIVKGK